MTITAHFDGRAFVPESPVDLPVGTTVEVNIDVVTQEESPHKWMLELGADLPDSPGDLAHQHDHYLYGTPKKP
jgi:hypothetical protein